MKYLILSILAFCGCSAHAASELPEQFDLCTFVQAGAVYVKTQHCSYKAVREAYWCGNREIVLNFPFNQETLVNASKQGNADQYITKIVNAMDELRTSRHCDYFSIQMSSRTKPLMSKTELQKAFEANPFHQFQAFDSSIAE